MPPLNSLDLFAGIGGISFALHGLARPIAYCEKAQNAVDVLRHNMRAKRLPAAPICRDITDLNAAWLQHEAGWANSRRVDLIVAGSPCVGFSTAGMREGFRNPESALFAELLRVLDEVSTLQRRRPPAVFLENVANILHIGVRHVVAELCWRRGFDLRWCVLPASSIGAPQLRSRWYCLATPAGFTASWTGLRYRPYSWTSGEPPRMTISHDPVDASSSGSGLAGRVAMLGNSVVPDAVRCAFMYLLCPDPEVNLRASSARFAADLSSARATPVQRSWGPSHQTLPACAQVKGRTLHELAPIRHRPRRYRIRLDPNAFKPAQPTAHREVGRMVTKPEARDLWGTLTKSDGTGNLLTERNKKKIMVQVRFEERTPDRLRAGRMTAEFAEWVMGFPIDWTRITHP